MVTASQGIEAGTGETARLDGEATKARSAQADAPNDSWQTRAERAEAECKELRAKLDHALDDINELGARLAIELAASQHGAG